MAYPVLISALTFAIIFWPTKDKDSWQLPAFLVGGMAILAYLFG